MANPMRDGEVREVWGSGSKPYQLKCIGQVHSCSCRPGATSRWPSTSARAAARVVTRALKEQQNEAF